MTKALAENKRFRKTKELLDEKGFNFKNDDHMIVITGKKITHREHTERPIEFEANVGTFFLDADVKTLTFHYDAYTEGLYKKHHQLSLVQTPVEQWFETLSQIAVQFARDLKFTTIEVLGSTFTSSTIEQQGYQKAKRFKYIKEVTMEKKAPAVKTKSKTKTVKKKQTVK